MRVLYEEGVAIHFGPESCGHDREVVPEALTGGVSSRVLSREIVVDFRAPPLSLQARGKTGPAAKARTVRALRGRRPRARTQALHAGAGRHCPFYPFHSEAGWPATLSLGLGSTTIGMIPPVVERSKELRARYGIPKDHRVLTSLILGHPKFRYRQGIRRDLAGVQCIVSRSRILVNTSG